MRKRKLKKSVKIFFALILLAIVGAGCYIGFTDNDISRKIFGEKKVEEKKEEVEEVKEEEKKEEEPVVKEPEEKRMSIVMVGDALIHGAVYMDAYKNGKYNFSKMFTDIAPIISNYDLRYYNQESIIGGGAPQHYPRLNTPDALAQNLI